MLPLQPLHLPPLLLPLSVLLRVLHQSLLELVRPVHFHLLIVLLQQPLLVVFLLAKLLPILIEVNLVLPSEVPIQLHLLKLPFRKNQLHLVLLFLLWFIHRLLLEQSAFQILIFHLLLLLFILFLLLDLLLELSQFGFFGLLLLLFVFLFIFLFFFLF